MSRHAALLQASQWLCLPSVNCNGKAARLLGGHGAPAHMLYVLCHCHDCNPSISQHTLGGTPQHDPEVASDCPSDETPGVMTLEEFVEHATGITMEDLSDEESNHLCRTQVSLAHHKDETLGEYLTGLSGSWVRPGCVGSTLHLFWWDEPPGGTSGSWFRARVNGVINTTNELQVEYTDGNTSTVYLGANFVHFGMHPPSGRERPSIVPPGPTHKEASTRSAATMGQDEAAQASRQDIHPPLLPQSPGLGLDRSASSPRLAPKFDIPPPPRPPSPLPASPPAPPPNHHSATHSCHDASQALSIRIRALHGEEQFKGATGSGSVPGVAAMEVEFQERHTLAGEQVIYVHDVEMDDVDPAMCEAAKDVVYRTDHEHKANTAKPVSAQGIVGLRGTAQGGSPRQGTNAHHIPPAGAAQHTTHTVQQGTVGESQQNGAPSRAEHKGNAVGTAPEPNIAQQASPGLDADRDTQMADADSPMTLLSEAQCANPSSSAPNSSSQEPVSSHLRPGQPVLSLHSPLQPVPSQPSPIKSSAHKLFLVQPNLCPVERREAQGAAVSATTPAPGNTSFVAGKTAELLDPVAATTPATAAGVMSGEPTMAPAAHNPASGVFQACPLSSVAPVMQHGNQTAATAPLAHGSHAASPTAVAVLLETGRQASAQAKPTTISSASGSSNPGTIVSAVASPTGVNPSEKLAAPLPALNVNPTAKLRLCLPTRNSDMPSPTSKQATPLQTTNPNVSSPTAKPGLSSPTAKPDVLSPTTKSGLPLPTAKPNAARPRANSATVGSGSNSPTGMSSADTAVEAAPEIAASAAALPSGLPSAVKQPATQQGDLLATKPVPAHPPYDTVQTEKQNGRAKLVKLLPEGASPMQNAQSQEVMDAWALAMQSAAVLANGAGMIGVHVGTGWNGGRAHNGGNVGNAGIAGNSEPKACPDRKLQGGNQPTVTAPPAMAPRNKRDHEVAQGAGKAQQGPVDAHQSQAAKGTQEAAAGAKRPGHLLTQAVPTAPFQQASRSVLSAPISAQYSSHVATGKGGAAGQESTRKSQQAKRKALQGVEEVVEDGVHAKMEVVRGLGFMLKSTGSQRSVPSTLQMMRVDEPEEMLRPVTSLVLPAPSASINPHSQSAETPCGTSQALRAGGLRSSNSCSTTQTHLTSVQLPADAPDSLQSFRFLTPLEFLAYLTHHRPQAAARHVPTQTSMPGSYLASMERESLVPSATTFPPGRLDAPLMSVPSALTVQSAPTAVAGSAQPQPTSTLSLHVRTPAFNPFSPVSTPTSARLLQSSSPSACAPRPSHASPTWALPITQSLLSSLKLSPEQLSHIPPLLWGQLNAQVEALAQIENTSEASQDHPLIMNVRTTLGVIQAVCSLPAELPAHKEQRTLGTGADFFYMMGQDSPHRELETLGATSSSHPDTLDGIASMLCSVQPRQHGKAVHTQTLAQAARRWEVRECERMSGHKRALPPEFSLPEAFSHPQVHVSVPKPGLLSTRSAPVHSTPPFPDPRLPSGTPSSHSPRSTTAAGASLRPTRSTSAALPAPLQERANRHSSSNLALRAPPSPAHSQPLGSRSAGRPHAHTRPATTYRLSIGDATASTPHHLPPREAPPRVTQHLSAEDPASTLPTHPLTNCEAPTWGAQRPATTSLTAPLPRWLRQDQTPLSAPHTSPLRPTHPTSSAQRPHPRHSFDQLSPPPPTSPPRIQDLPNLESCTSTTTSLLSALPVPGHLQGLVTPRSPPPPTPHAPPPAQPKPRPPATTSNSILGDFISSYYNVANKLVAEEGIHPFQRPAGSAGRPAAGPDTRQSGSVFSMAPHSTDSAKAATEFRKSLSTGDVSTRFTGSPHVRAEIRGTMSTSRLQGRDGGMGGSLAAGMGGSLAAGMGGSLSGGKGGSGRHAAPGSSGPVVLGAMLTDEAVSWMPAPFQWLGGRGGGPAVGGSLALQDSTSLKLQSASNSLPVPGTSSLSRPPGASLPPVSPLHTTRASLHEQDSISKSPARMARTPPSQGKAGARILGLDLHSPFSPAATPTSALAEAAARMSSQLPELPDTHDVSGIAKAVVLVLNTIEASREVRKKVMVRLRSMSADERIICYVDLRDACMRNDWEGARDAVGQLCDTD